MYAQRIKELRKKNNMTQVQLAEKLGVSKGTVAMWETGQRRPGFEAFNDLCEVFDRRLDYILGHSDDESPFNLTKEDVEVLICGTVEDMLHELFMKYLSLDEYGTQAVKNLIENEYSRCKEQNTLVETDGYDLTIKVSPDEE